MKIFPSGKILLQHSVLSYKLDLYFPEHNLAEEFDKKGYKNKSVDYEIKRQKAIKKELDCEFIGINPDEKDFDMDIHINKIQNHIVNHGRNH